MLTSVLRNYQYLEGCVRIAERRKARTLYRHTFSYSMQIKNLITIILGCAVTLTLHISSENVATRSIPTSLSQIAIIALGYGHGSIGFTISVNKTMV